MWQPECCSAYGTTCCIVIIHCVSEKTRQFWQAKVSTSTEKFWYFYVYCISTFSKMISTFNFPCPFTFTYFITLFAFKYLRRKWRDTSDLKRRLIDTWTSISRPCSDFMDMLRRLISCRIIIIIIYHKRHRSRSIEKAVTCSCEGEGHHFEYQINENQLFSEPPSIPRKTRYFHVISVAAI